MKNFLFILMVSLFCSFTSCNKDNCNPVTSDEDTSGKISVGSSVALSTQSISSSGGSIKVNKPGDPLDGMEITVKPNLVSSIKNFKVSYAEIKSHSPGQNCNPITPLISVRYKGGYSARRWR